MKVDEKEKHIFYLVKVKVDTQIKYILTFDIDKLTKKADYFTTSVVFFLFYSDSTCHSFYLSQIS